MKERPILFNGDMVRAILDGHKLQTRRLVKADFCEMADRGDGSLWPWREDLNDGGDIWYPCPLGEPGDRLWVREAHAIFDTHGQHRNDGQRWGPWGGLPTRLSPDGTQISYYRQGFDRSDPGRWRPSIHMPRWASRITLENTGVRVERLQDISEADAEQEGIDFLRRHPDADETLTARQLFESLWEHINGPGSWNANPWVWVVEFRRSEGKEAGDVG